jgi:transposase
MLKDAMIDSVYLARGSTDMRKSIDGLAILVQLEFNLDPFSSSLFVFCNKQRNKLKILHWDTNGFWLYYRRLERGKFHWPSDNTSSGPFKITRRQLNWLLDGLSLEQKKAHPIVTAKTVI